MNLKLFLVILLTMSLTGLLSFVSTPHVAAQGQSTALERGYRTGYSDGYTAGYRDISDHASRDYQNKEDYKRADRSYNETWGPIEDYRDGYQQGFESGYAAGYERAQFNSNVPVGLKRRGTIGTPDSNNGDATAANNTTNTTSTTDSTDSSAATQNNGPITIPRNTILALELLNPLSTDVNHSGDRFQARVVEPAEYPPSKPC